MNPASVVITAVGWAMPTGFGSRLSPPWDRCAREAFDAVEVLGRKGLLGKDHATRLALGAAVRASDTAASDVAQTASGVVVACNLGNLDTVCRVAHAIESGPTRGLSILDLPNASSNVISSAIALRLRYRALNVLVSSGSDAGLQAVRVAMNAIRTGRAARMVVVGVEAFASPQKTLLGDSLARWCPSTSMPPMTECAAAVVLEAPSTAARRDRKPLAALGPVRAAPAGRLAETLPPAKEGFVDAWLTPAGRYPPIAAEIAAAPCPGGGQGLRFDLHDACGETYGTAGVLQAAVAADMIARRQARRVLVSCGGVCGEGFASAMLSALPEQPVEPVHDAQKRDD